MKFLTMLCLMTAFTTHVSAQDMNFSQMKSDAATRSRTPEGDRGYYGLWAKDKLMSPPKLKTRWESAEDSISKRGEFVALCGKAFTAYEEKDALNTIIYGDSALRTGFDNAQLYLYMAFSYEELSDYKQAERSFKSAKARQFPGAKAALQAFKRRMKERKKKR